MIEPISSFLAFAELMNLLKDFLKERESGKDINQAWLAISNHSKSMDYLKTKGVVID